MSWAVVVQHFKESHLYHFQNTRVDGIKPNLIILLLFPLWRPLLGLLDVMQVPNKQEVGGARKSILFHNQRSIPNSKNKQERSKRLRAIRIFLSRYASDQGPKRKKSSENNPDARTPHKKVYRAATSSSNRRLTNYDNPFLSIFFRDV